jgi:hypothetical protein
MSIFIYLFSVCLYLTYALPIYYFLLLLYSLFILFYSRLFIVILYLLLIYYLFYKIQQFRPPLLLGMSGGVYDCHTDHYMKYQISFILRLYQIKYSASNSQCRTRSKMMSQANENRCRQLFNINFALSGNQVVFLETMSCI